MKRLVWWSFIDRQLKNEERSQCALLKKANIECKSDTWWHNSTKLWWFSFQEHSIITQVEPKNVFRSWERSSVPEWGWVYGHDDFLAVKQTNKLGGEIVHVVSSSYLLLLCMGPKYRGVMMVHHSSSTERSLCSSQRREEYTAYEDLCILYHHNH